MRHAAASCQPPGRGDPAGRRCKLRRASGQALVEMALILAIMLPLTLGLVAIMDVVWTYHALTTLTRQGAQYAATHCYEDDAGTNVTDWMKTNAPAFLDRPQIGSTVQIQVTYWTHDWANHSSEAFSCGASCTPTCTPDAVTVSISNYQFTHLLPLLNLQPLSLPTFATTVEMQSAGADPEQGQSFPE
jgi:Flp pilus assembly protein TadG